MKQNPVLQEAIENKQKEKALQDMEKPRYPIADVLLRMAQRKPPTKSQMQVNNELLMPMYWTVVLHQTENLVLTLSNLRHYVEKST